MRFSKRSLPIQMKSPKAKGFFFQIKNLFMPAAFVFCFILFSACASAGEPQLHKEFSIPEGAGSSLSGTWREKGGLTEFTFSEGEKLMIQVLGGPVFSGSYRVEKDRLSLSYKLPFGSSQEQFFFTLSPEGDHLQIGSCVYEKINA